ncbi:tyrosine recombinase XerC [Seohaeicola saemankumensis]|uniref:Tyrosine recombinase XerC n=1 Tax=Seohaeicola saemankumensis TaxID=481181 RepID=A0ABW3TCS3_9RHOB
MTYATKIDLDMALLPKDTPMFSDLVLILEDDQSVNPIRRRDMISGLTRIAMAIGRPLQDIPCSPHWLQPRLAKVAPGALKISLKTWQNAISNARSAMVHAQIVDQRPHRKTHLNEDWRRLWDLILASNDRTLRPTLSRFIYFLNDAGVAPQEVSDDHAQAFHLALIRNEISKSPLRVYRSAVFGWNLAGKRISEWPDTKLDLPALTTVIKLPESALPPSFIADLDSLMARLATPDILDDATISKARRPATIYLYRRQILRFASEIVHSGVPAEELLSIGNILEPQMAQRGLRQMLSRTNNKPNNLTCRTAELLRFLGRATQQDPKTQAQLERLAGKLKLPSKQGMTRKNRDRLRVLLTEENSFKIFTMPDRLFQRPPQGKANAFTQALAREDALAMAILLYCPVRIKNLAGIHLEQHLQRPGDGRVFLVLTEEEVKNARPLEFELTQDVIKMINAHLKTRSLELCPAGTPWLFPRRDGRGPMDPNHLARRLKRRIRKETGLEMNAHLFRHFAVAHLLDARPGSYELARRLLGHSDVSHTINMYAGLEVKSAIKAYADLVGDKKKGWRA